MASLVVTDPARRGYGVALLASNLRGFLGYLLIYQPISSAAPLRGYAEHLTRRPRSW